MLSLVHAAMPDFANNASQQIRQITDLMRPKIFSGFDATVAAPPTSGESDP
jgi:hypothetical protein